MCSTALAPGTASPSMAVVRKIRLSQTMGDESPRPGIAVFHLMFLSALHSAGRLVSEDTPLPSGPRHADQLLLGPALAASANNSTNNAERIKFSPRKKNCRFIVSPDTPRLLASACLVGYAE